MPQSLASIVDHRFTRLANRIARFTGSPEGFAIALLAMVLWAALGPLVGYGAIWQLSVNTGTTIVTFLMVFIIQNSQNRDTRSLQVKIDELIRATEGASNSLLDLESLSAAEIDKLHKRYWQIAERAKALGYDFETGSPDLPAATSGGELAKAAVIIEKATRTRASATRKSSRRSRARPPASA
jgi:low affinity Fe/Cu permease